MYTVLYYKRGNNEIQIKVIFVVNIGHEYRTYTSVHV